MSLYCTLVVTTYEVMTRDEGVPNFDGHTPSSRYVGRKLDDIRQRAFRPYDTEDYRQFLNHSFTANAHDEVDTLCAAGVPYEQAVRKRLDDVFAGDVFRMLLKKGHRSSIPNFYNYEFMLRKAAAWAEEKAAADQTDTPATDLLDQRIREQILAGADDQELRWVARRASIDMELPWSKHDAMSAETAQELRDEMPAITDAVVRDATEYLNT